MGRRNSIDQGVLIFGGYFSAGTAWLGAFCCIFCLLEYLQYRFN